jgi:CubicO group peptidase (beta-lactamase class C family)
MKKIAFSLVLLFYLVNAVGQTTAEEVHELLKAYSSVKAFNGSALVAQHGKILISEGFGFKNISLKTPNDSGSIFRIGTLTKPITASMVLQMQEAGQISVDNKLSIYIPDFPIADSISLKDLLDNRSGLRPYPEFNYSGQSAIDSLIAFIKNYPLNFKPGTEFENSNTNYLLLGYIIQQVGGKPFYQTIREKIFKSREMTHSGFDYQSLSSGGKTTGYLNLNSKTIKPAPILDSGILYSEGGLYSNTSDLYKWVLGFFSGRDLSSFLNDHYDLGWIIDSAYAKKTFLQESLIPGFSGFMAWIPHDSTCIILLENRNSGDLLQIAENINAILNKQPYDFPVPRAEIEVDQAILKGYTGLYRMGEKLKLKIELDEDQLYVEALGLGRSVLFAEQENYFYTKVSNIEIEFIKNAEGKVNRLILHQKGETIEGYRIE